MSSVESFGARLEPCHSKRESLLTISWTDSVKNYLGIGITQCQLSTSQDGVNINNLRVKTFEWHERNLTLFKRAFAYDSVLLSTVWYAAQVVPCRAADVQLFHRWCAVFIWQSYFEKMRQNDLFISKFAVNVKVNLKLFSLFRDKTTTVIAGTLKTLSRRYLDPWLLPSQEDAPKRTPELRHYR